jgi:hypothetical protein
MSRKNPQSRLQTMLDHTERQAIEWAYQQTQSLPKAAELLGISRAHIYKRVDALDMRHLIRSQKDEDLQPENEIAEEAPETPIESPDEDETEAEPTPEPPPDSPEEAVSSPA